MIASSQITPGAWNQGEKQRGNSGIKSRTKITFKCLFSGRHVEDPENERPIHPNMHERSPRSLIVSEIKARIVTRRKRAATSREAAARSDEMKKIRKGRSKLIGFYLMHVVNHFFLVLTGRTRRNLERGLDPANEITARRDRESVKTDSTGRLRRNHHRRR